MAAFQTFVEAKGWPHAAEALAHATALQQLGPQPAARCLRSLPEDVAVCTEQLRVELVHALRTAAWHESLDEVTAYCAAELKVLRTALRNNQHLPSAAGT